MNIVDVLLIVITAAVIIRAGIKVYRQRKSGGCGCGCDGCTSKNICRKNISD